MAGLSRRDAALKACRLRLRPIVMTSLAFILGVLPLLVSRGAGAEMRRTLGTTVFSGMLGVTVFGDVAPDGRSMLNEVSVSLLDSGRAFVFSMLPQGLYSLVRLRVHEVHVDGTYRGVPLHISFEDESSAPVDLRSPSGVDVVPGHDGTFSISIDDNAWFANQLLDSASASGGQIVITGQSNGTVLNTLASRIMSSFTLAPAAPM